MENKIKLSKALVVNKAEISKLQESQMSKIKGGFNDAPGGAAGGSGAVSCQGASCANSCNSGSCNTGGN